MSQAQDERQSAKDAARGGLSAGAVKKLVRARDGYRCTKCGMSEAIHREKYGTALEVHRLVPGSFYTLDGCITTCRPCNAKLPRLPRGGTDLESQPNTTNLFFELPPEVLDEVKRFAEERGEKLRETIYHALRRHLKYPPPPIELPTEPLPDSPAAQQNANEVRAAKPAAKKAKKK